MSLEEEEEDEDDSAVNKLVNFYFLILNIKHNSYKLSYVLNSL